METKKEIGIKVFLGEEQIENVEELKVILDFDGEEAEVNLKNAVIRSMVLAQENIILKTAISQLQGGAPQETGQIISPQRFYEGRE